MFIHSLFTPFVLLLFPLYHHVVSPSGPPAASPLTNEETALKRPDTTESLNSSMSNGTTDAGRDEKPSDSFHQTSNLMLLQPSETSLAFLSDLFDSHDDRDDDAEGESVEEHKSVIMHLLSQVRLGMDLTKVTASEQSSVPIGIHFVATVGANPCDCRMNSQLYPICVTTSKARLNIKPFLLEFMKSRAF